MVFLQHLRSWGVTAFAAVAWWSVVNALAQAPCVNGWTDLGGGVHVEPPQFAWIRAFATYDDGNGPALYVGGRFDFVGEGQRATNLARWDGTKWESFEYSFGRIDVIKVLDLGSGPELYVGGTEYSPEFGMIVRYSGKKWEKVGGYLAPFLFGFVSDVALFDEGDGDRLFITGSFKFGLDPNTRDGIARLGYDGQWEGVGGSLYGGPWDGVGSRLVSVPSGAMSGLYVAGSFQQAGAVSCNNVAKWDGKNWSPLGSGLYHGPPLFILAVPCLTARVEAGNTVLYAGGRFTLAPGATSGCIARWDGTSWSLVGGGVPVGGTQPVSYVSSLAEYAPVPGAQFVVGGRFAAVGGTPVSNLAIWDGAAWSPFSSAVLSTAPESVIVRALYVWERGADKTLLAGGIFNTIGGGTTVSNLAEYKCITGDLNGDGKVGQEDLGILLASYGVSAGGDLDGDKDTDQADLGILLATYEP